MASLRGERKEKNRKRERENEKKRKKKKTRDIRGLWRSERHSHWSR